MCCTCPAHLISLDMITWIMCSDKYKLRSSWLCNFLFPLLLLCSNITSALGVVVLWIAESRSEVWTSAKYATFSAIWTPKYDFTVLSWSPSCSYVQLNTTLYNVIQFHWILSVIKNKPVGQGILVLGQIIPVEVLKMALMKIQVFRDVTPCRVVNS